MRFQKVSDALMTRGKLSEVERCTIFLSKLPRGKRKVVLRETPLDKFEFTALLKLVMKPEADDYKDSLWRGMLREDYSFYKEYGTDRCPDFNDKPWAERRYLMDWDKSHRSGDNDAVIEEMQEKMKEMARQIANFETKVRTTYRDKPGSPYSLRWDRRNTDRWRSVEDRNPRMLADYRARERDEDERRRKDEEDRRRRNEEDRRRREEDDRRRREDEERRRRDDNIDRDRRRDEYRGGDSYGREDRAEQYLRSPRDQYPRSPRYGDGAEGYWSPGNFNLRDREDSRSRWESDRDRRDGYRSSYERTERDGDRREEPRGQYERGGYPASSGYLKSPNYPRSPGPSN
ncbi:hypothetical protein CBR_g36507 [Chara braunii]|uniref:Uncharacterized protein n=1 Tax=Chara braunii TaxID=69332 RepID=A0A388LL56_CHABU|nr:hypothetical protein CBR_g36507 [Chara braunii]|eukprot:GBG82981.1 hypothetical protein CBR_g36507 [Chara braunii]